MRIYPAVHYTMGGLWVDYNLMSNVPGLFVLGEANFSDHGANRLGASALMQGLPTATSSSRTRSATTSPSTTPSAVTPSTTRSRGRGRGQARIDRCSRSRASGPREFHREPGRVMWDHVGMSRNERAAAGARARSASCARSSGRTCRCPASRPTSTRSSSTRGRVADYLEFGELLALDALHRTESCGGHFREESQTPDGEAKRDDEHFTYVAAWEYTGAARRRCCTRSRSSSRT